MNKLIIILTQTDFVRFMKYQNNNKISPHILYNKFLFRVNCFILVLQRE